MNNPFLVRRGKPARDLHAEINGLSKCNRGAADHLGQRLALQQFGDQVGHAEKRAHLIYSQNIRMIQRCGRLGLLLKPQQAFGIE